MSAAHGDAPRRAAALDPETVARIVRAALAEDRADRDITTLATVPPEQRGRALFIARQAGVLCGLEVAHEAFRQRSAEIEWRTDARDGDALAAGARFARVDGPLHAILAAERVALNLLQRMCGMATVTAAYVRAADEGASAAGLAPPRVLDTRKTTPGLRPLERYAVGTGGGYNHRDTLADGVLIKDNHIAAARARGGTLREVVERARADAPHGLRIEVEVTTTQEAQEAFAAGAEIVLLDNMTPDEMRRIAADAPAGVTLEASGGVTLETIGRVAATGVGLISVGALTHSAPALDISLEVEPTPTGAQD